VCHPDHYAHLYFIVNFFRVIAPYQCGGNIVIFYGYGVGKILLIMELINNVANDHGHLSIFVGVGECTQTQWSIKGNDWEWFYQAWGKKPRKQVV